MSPSGMGFGGVKDEQNVVQCNEKHGIKWNNMVKHGTTRNNMAKTWNNTE